MLCSCLPVRWAKTRCKTKQYNLNNYREMYFIYIYRWVRAAGARNTICIIRGYMTHIVRKFCVTLRHIHAGFTLDARHIRESDANVACTCRARIAQQEMLLDPSVYSQRRCSLNAGGVAICERYCVNQLVFLFVYSQKYVCALSFFLSHQYSNFQFQSSISREILLGY
jgi:hypothetical protein